MIKSFKHKSLEKLFFYDDSRGVNPTHTSKINRKFDRLDSSTNSYDMNLSGYRLHQLKGAQKGMWSVWVSGNWRIIFQFEGKDTQNVDTVEYHTLNLYRSNISLVG